MPVRYSSMASRPECAANAAGDSTTAGGNTGSEGTDEADGAAEEAGASGEAVELDTDGLASWFAAAAATLENARTCMCPTRAAWREAAPMRGACCASATSGLLLAAAAAVAAMDALHEQDAGVADTVYMPHGQRPDATKTEAGADARDATSDAAAAGENPAPPTTPAAWPAGQADKLTDVRVTGAA